ncbi:MAG: large repetitive protein [Thermoanaerobaculia bacterium]|jgi:hypothetical protein|nr:large repetitive protein [Thermoanaerobaculia bacterium]
MKQTKTRCSILAVTALLALFAGCKGESPTAPPPITGTTGTGGTTGGTQPPVGANIALTVTSASPFTGSTSTITATVTLNNAPVPNGTAVEFSTTSVNANFTDTSDNPTTLIRTTTAGVAKATVTSSVAGPVVVSVTVNNVTKSVTLNFQDPVVPVTPPSNAPTIGSISPASGLPTGNQTIVITGTNFRVPVRVLIDPGSASGLAPKEAFVTNVTPTQITATTPAFDLGVSQQLVASVTVIVEAGTPTEQRVTKAAAFTYTAPVLTPVFRALAPTSGPIDGGTRVSITGDAFEAPVQVFFGSAQAQVLGVTFHQIDVLSPTARETNANGSGAVTGPVDIRILNVNSGKSVSAPAAFRYVNKMQITAITPNQGPFTGGTKFTIDGIGFNDPVTVFLDGVAASVTKVSSTEIIGFSSGIALSSCADSTGAVIVTNVDNGDTATAPTAWIYRVLKPVIVGVSSSGPIQPGASIAISVLNVGQFPSLTFGTTTIPINSSTANSNGTTTLTAVVPLNIQFTTQACSGGATAPIATAFPIVVTNLETGCASPALSVTVNPIPIGKLLLTPNPLVLTAKAATPGDATATPPVPPTPPQPGNGAFTITNNGAAPLTITSVVSSNPAVYTVTSDPSGTTLAVCETAIVGVRYGPEAAGSSSGAQITVSASSGNPTQTITARETVTGTTQ